MDSELIIITEYCNQSNIETQFIALLEEEDLVKTSWIEGVQYLPTSQLGNVERYARWYYDLSINIAGIDTIQMLLSKIGSMQNELNNLNALLNSFKDKESFDFDNDLFN